MGLLHLDEEELLEVARSRHRKTGAPDGYHPRRKVARNRGASRFAPPRSTASALATDGLVGRTRLAEDATREAFAKPLAGSAHRVAMVERVGRELG